MNKIRKNDTVVCLAGRDKGKKGRVLYVFPKENRALVEGINLIKRHSRRTREDQQGGIIQKEAPLNLSNLMLLCNKCNKPTKVRMRILKDGNKVRSCKRCGEVIS